MKTTEAIVLAGGLGTRLRHLIPGLPKCMAPVNKRPFLEYLLDYLVNQNIKKVILSVGYRHEVIIEHFGNKYKKLSLEYAVEKEPLGTGGAIAYACGFSDNKHIFVLNGDTLFPVDLYTLEEKHFSENALITIVLRYLDNISRFGSVIINDNGQIKGFTEKQNKPVSGCINGGIYLIDKTVFENYKLPDKFSFEKDIMETYYLSGKFYSVLSDAYFLDIGVPEDYARAEAEFPGL